MSIKSLFKRKKSMKREFLDLIKKGFIRIHNDHEDMNCGGCGVFAVITYPFIKRYYPDVEIVSVSYGSPDNIEETRNNLISNGDDLLNKDNWWDLSFWHILLKVNVDNTDYLIDSEGVYNLKEYEKRECKKVSVGSFTYEEMKSFCSSGAGWNNDFDRRQIPEIKRKVEDFFRTNEQKVA